jgi:Ca-activated chloride channel family protein
VESEDRLDAAMNQIHRRIGAPVVSGLSLSTQGLPLVPDTVSPARLPDLFPGAPLVVTGRYAGATDGAAVTVAGRSRPGDPWSVQVPAQATSDPSVTAVWARGHLRDLEDRYAGLPYGTGGRELEQQIVAASLRFGVLCRFTAWVAIDERVVTEGGQPHRVVQPVEMPAGWDMPLAQPAAQLAMASRPLASGAAMLRGRRAGGHAAFGPPAGSVAAAMPAPAQAARPPMPGAAMSAPAEAERAPRPPTPGVRAVAAREAQRLRDAADAPEYERRELLADLGTRLTALASDMGGERAQSVRALIQDLAEDRLAGLTGQALTALWDRALAFLDALAGKQG